MDRRSIFSTLESIGAVSVPNVTQFASRTRNRDVPVYRDQVTGVIFIDDFYVGDTEYVNADYRTSGEKTEGVQDAVDTERRVSELRQFVVGKSILDFGFGSGNFLRATMSLAASAYGVELDAHGLESLQRDGIECASSLDGLNGAFDTAFMFHVLEHLPDPIQTLGEIRRSLRPDPGFLVVEVPHARDYLISHLGCAEFTEFTLWSQHLILHTRDSLERLLHAAGFQHVSIRSVQRFSIANHLTWLRWGVPGGHESLLSLIETDGLRREYASSLAAVDASDTLLAVARV